VVARLIVSDVCYFLIMPLKERQAAIKKLQELRKSRVLVHFLSDRRVGDQVPIVGMSTQMAAEAYPTIYEHLRTTDNCDKLDLVLHTSGGDLNSVWPLVKLFRSLSKTFSVIVPMKAHSAGTLICLGSDEVVMTKAATLSPIDPTTVNAFNPVFEKARLPISVEDVTAYLDLARETEEEGGGFGLTSDDHRLEVFKELSQKVHPLALGNVKRVHSQIRSIARRLLNLHVKDDDKKDEYIKRVVTVLTEELFSHSHQIDRSEMIEILGEEIVKVPSAEEETAIWDLYKHYETMFKLRSTFNIKEWLGTQTEKELSVAGAIIETQDMSHTFRGVSTIRRITDIPPGVQMQLPPGQSMPLIPGLPTRINVEPISQGWYPSKKEG